MIEFERGLLPYLLMEPNKKSNLRQSNYTSPSEKLMQSNYEAHCIMEQRVQSLITTVNVCRHILQKSDPIDQSCPLRRATDEEFCNIFFKDKNSKIKCFIYSMRNFFSKIDLNYFQIYIDEIDNIIKSNPVIFYYT